MKRKRHNSDQIIRKPREAEAMLSHGQVIVRVCQALEISGQTFHRSPRRLRQDQGR